MDMRYMLDWACTRTTLEWYQWLKLAAIHQSLHERQVLLQYWRYKGRDFGSPQPYYYKVLVGVTYFVGLVFVIWAPLLVSVVSAKYSKPQSVPVLGAKLDISLETRSGDLFSLSSISSYSQGPEISSQCSLDAFVNSSSWVFESEREEVAVALQEDCIMKNSMRALYMRSEGQLWGATPVRRNQLLKALLAGSDMGTSRGVSLYLRVTFSRNTTGITQSPRGKMFETEVSMVTSSPEVT